MQLRLRQALKVKPKRSPLFLASKPLLIIVCTVWVLPKDMHGGQDHHNFMRPIPTAPSNAGWVSAMGMVVALPINVGYTGQRFSKLLSKVAITHQ